MIDQSGDIFAQCSCDVLTSIPYNIHTSARVKSGQNPSHRSLVIAITSSTNLFRVYEISVHSSWGSTIDARVWGGVTLFCPVYSRVIWVRVWTRMLVRLLIGLRTSRWYDIIGVGFSTKKARTAQL
jgi:hypothetical protein